MGYSPRGRKELDTTEQLTQILISSFDHHNSAIILRDFFFLFFFFEPNPEFQKLYDWWKE